MRASQHDATMQTLTPEVVQRLLDRLDRVGGQLQHAARVQASHPEGVDGSLFAARQTLNEVDTELERIALAL